MSSTTRMLFVFCALSIRVPIMGAQEDAETACIMLRCPVTSGPFGTSQRDAACIRRCLLGETARPPARSPASESIPARDGARAAALRFTSAWRNSASYRGQTEIIERHVGDLARGATGSLLLSRIHRWTVRNVELDRRSTRSSPLVPSVEMHVANGRLIFDDTFFAASRNRQKNLFVFELGKVVWLDILSVAESRGLANGEARDAARRVRSLVVRHAELFRTMKLTEFNGSHLGDLGDGPDAPSAFGYAFRALLLDTQFPAEIRADRTRWTPLRRELETALLILMQRRQ